VSYKGFSALKFVVTFHRKSRSDVNPTGTASPSHFIIDGKDVVFYRKVSRAHGDRSSAGDILTDGYLGWTERLIHWIPWWQSI
jgi:hypothetical protein